MRAGRRNPSERRAAQAAGNSEQPGPIQSSNAMTPQRPPGWKGRSSRLSATRPVWPGHDGGNRLGGRVWRPPRPRKRPPRRSAGFKPATPPCWPAPSERRTHPDYGVRQRVETRCEDDRASGLHRQQVDDVGPVVAMSVAVAHQPARRSRRGRPGRGQHVTKAHLSWANLWGLGKERVKVRG